MCCHSYDELIRLFQRITVEWLIRCRFSWWSTLCSSPPVSGSFSPERVFILPSFLTFSPFSTHAVQDAGEKTQLVWSWLYSKWEKCLKIQRGKELASYSLSLEEVWYFETNVWIHFYPTVCWTALFANLSSLPAAVKIAVSLAQKLCTLRSDKKLPKKENPPHTRCCYSSYSHCCCHCCCLWILLLITHAF